MLYCPVCTTELESSEDSRQEWTRIEYSCAVCGNDFSRLITYEEQSNIVKSDVMEQTDLEIREMIEEYESAFGGDSGNDADYCRGGYESD